jgi:hypothetical protein
MQGVLPTFCRLDGLCFLGFLGGFGVGDGDGRSAVTWCFLLLEGDVGWVGWGAGGWVGWGEEGFGAMGAVG